MVKNTYLGAKWRRFPFLVPPHFLLLLLPILLWFLSHFNQSREYLFLNVSQEPHILAHLPYISIFKSLFFVFGRASSSLSTSLFFLSMVRAELESGPAMFLVFWDQKYFLGSRGRGKGEGEGEGEPGIELVTFFHEAPHLPLEPRPRPPGPATMVDELGSQNQVEQNRKQKKDPPSLNSFGPRHGLFSPPSSWFFSPFVTPTRGSQGPNSPLGWIPIKSSVCTCWHDLKGESLHSLTKLIVSVIAFSP